MVAPNKTEFSFADPHLAWEAERQAIMERIEELMELGLCQQAAGYDAQRKALDDAYDELLLKIETTPTLTAEAARTALELHDLEDVRLGLEDRPEHEIRAIRARLMAVGTIRRLLS